MKRLLGLLSVAALVCAGCGGDDGDGQARTVEASTTTTTEPSEDSTTTSAAPAALDAVVLQLTDMPTGWSVAPPDEDDDDSDDFCDGADPFNEIEPKEDAESNFQQSEFGPFASSGASIYEDDDQAGEVLDLLADMANDCQSFTQVEDDGTETEYTITPLSFPDLGDDTFAFRMSATTFLGPLTLDGVAVRDGDLVVTIVHGGIGAVDSALTESLMRDMLDRV